MNRMKRWSNTNNWDVAKLQLIGVDEGNAKPAPEVRLVMLSFQLSSKATMKCWCLGITNKVRLAWRLLACVEVRSTKKKIIPYCVQSELRMSKVLSINYSNTFK